ncbi:hypothetical protein SPRG_04716 [Saprolegnia parasitica CBS 223.65]|uniref:NADH:ubiquinone oxidoreductase intermediate-associated protein 30 domain-containing protein n=1 Tax=Saprolegnia parasitica (strain CBS 223.65) TaxID=695850 RepID=A0A067CNK6_SAPPC|nr:hypothetical protein SPRG_04716 [Saprolegnia parasitica CBS 223.65]KDO30815.1 hypothetical protein SPRG_04716 [Saprolegnia parasitica CBS 223.65]|eukprot:XP_012198512.1 hypothetical protein SPRG_04716 [Saprolegnia parasitica CBS 223.65]
MSRNSLLRRLVLTAESGVLSAKQLMGLRLNVAPEAHVFRFDKAEATDGWLVSSDRAIGGESTCSFEFVPTADDSDKEAPKVGAAVFSGRLSLSVQPTEQHVVRSGYCAIRGNVPRGLHLHGYEGLAMRIKTDGRTYRINAQADGWNPHDLYMGFLKAPANKWVEAELAFSDFILTSRGYVQVDDPAKLDPSSLRTIGIALADDKEGPFQISIEWIKAVEKVDTTNIAPKPRVSLKTELLDDDEIAPLEDDDQPKARRPRKSDLVI